MAGWRTSFPGGHLHECCDKCALRDLKQYNDGTDTFQGAPNLEALIQHGASSCIKRALSWGRRGGHGRPTASSLRNRPSWAGGDDWRKNLGVQSPEIGGTRQKAMVQSPHPLSLAPRFFPDYWKSTPRSKMPRATQVSRHGVVRPPRREMQVLLLLLLPLLHRPWREHADT